MFGADSAHELFLLAIDAAQAGSKEEARNYFERMLLNEDADLDERMQAWLYLSALSDDPKEKREYLQTVLIFSPNQPEAVRRLAVLDGKLDPKEIVDADHLPAAPPQSDEAQARRFVCRRCGGRMSFTPEGNALVCDFCHHREWVTDAMAAGLMVDEQNFTLAMATLKAHSAPVAMRSFKCETCGASYVLSPEMLSLTCPYCGSAYVLKTTETSDVIPPEGIIPFALAQAQADAALKAWFNAHHLHANATLRDLYLPVWSFHIAGDLHTFAQNQPEPPPQIKFRLLETTAEQNETRAVYYNDVLVPASHLVPLELMNEMASFRAEALVPYDARYLANIPATTYDVPLSDASLLARWRVLESERAKSGLQLAGDLNIDSFKLALVPVWMGRFQDQDQQLTVVVNGQTGVVAGETPHHGAQKLFDWVMKE